MGNSASDLSNTFLPPLDTTRPLPAGTTGFFAAKMHIDGRERFYDVFVPLVHTAAPSSSSSSSSSSASILYGLPAPPAVAPASYRFPVVLALHGGAGNSREFEAYCKLSLLAQEKGFVLIYPNGTGKFKKGVFTWNAGPGKCGYAADKNVDDVKFVIQILNDISRVLPIDERRVFATGLSNGAMMCHRLITDPRISNRIAAIGPVAGVSLHPFTPGARKVPVIHFHSVNDQRAVYSGGKTKGLGSVVHDAVEPVMWNISSFHNDGSKVTPLAYPAFQKKHDASQTVHEAQKIVWPTPSNTEDVVLWKMKGPGHVWPSEHNIVYSPLIQAMCKPQTDVLDANRVMWDFFCLHPIF